MEAACAAWLVAQTWFMYKGVKLKLRILYILVTAEKTQCAVQERSTSQSDCTTWKYRFCWQHFSSDASWWAAIFFFFVTIWFISLWNKISCGWTCEEFGFKMCVQMINGGSFFFNYYSAQSCDEVWQVWGGLHHVAAMKRYNSLIQIDVLWKEGDMLY